MVMRKIRACPPQNLRIPHAQNLRMI